MRLFVKLVGVVVALGFVVVGSAVASAQLGSAGTVAPQGHAVVTPYNVSFSESGLPAGTNWSVRLAYLGCSCDGVHGTFTSNLSTFTIAVSNGTYRYTVLPVAGYYVNALAKGTFVVNGSDPSGVSVVFHTPVLYGVEFTETGLPSGTNWTVSLTGNGQEQERALEDLSGSSSGTAMNFSLPNGTYRYVVGEVNGSYLLNRTGRGAFLVNGASGTSLAIQFATPPSYALTFTETGLTAGTNWSVRISGFGGVPVHETISSSTSTLVFYLPNGSYRFAIGEVLGYALNGSASGQVSITTGPVGESVSFQVLGPNEFYAVTFQESGLASGHHWEAKVLARHTFGHSRSETESSNASTLTFELQNGSYRYTVFSVRGYTVADPSGTFTVAGASPATIPVNFTAVPTYTVTFNESGLANGTGWSVLVRSTTAGSTPWPIRIVEGSTTSSISFTLPNGSYCYTVKAVHGYTISGIPASGSFTVAGTSPATLSLTFTAK